MSITRFVASVAYTSTAPLVPAGTITALATTVPVGAFSDATTGCDCPAGQAVMYPSGPFGTAAKLSEYACAVAGTPHALEGIENVRVAAAARDGPPNGPFALRV